MELSQKLRATQVGSSIDKNRRHTEPIAASSACSAVRDMPPSMCMRHHETFRDLHCSCILLSNYPALHVWGLIKGLDCASLQSPGMTHHAMACQADPSMQFRKVLASGQFQWLGSGELADNEHLQKAVTTNGNLCPSVLADALQSLHCLYEVGEPASKPASSMLQI